MTNSNKNRFLTFFIFFLTSFLLGFVSSFIYKENINTNLLKNGISFDKTILNSENNIEKDLDLEKFYKVYSYIKNNYYDFDEITEKQLIDGTISGLVSSLGDEHSSYFNIKENTSFSEVLDQEFEGIGAVVLKDPLGIKLESIFKNSPAEKAGLLAGDIIVSADSFELAGMEQTEAISHIKGPAGTKVVLEISRNGNEGLIEKEVTRNKVEIPSIESEILDGNIGYISLSTFGEKTTKELKEALEKLKNTDGIIIDLRNNGGGYLEIAVQVLSDFIENKENLVITKIKGDIVESTLTSQNNGDIYNGKIVVLINENSASASEITAGALRYYDKAILVGKKSYGKGSVQEPFRLSDGSMVKITVAKWFTPGDKNIDGEGINPDIEVDFEKQDYDLDECINVGVCDEDLKVEDFEFYDRQKEEAIKVLKTFIQKGALQLTIDNYNNDK